MSEEQNNTDQGAEQPEQNQNEGQNNTTEQPADKGENWIPQSRFNEVNEKKKQAEKTLQEVADSFMEQVPEDMKDIVPNLPADQKIKWIQSAQQKGLFNKQPESGPDSQAPKSGKTEVDTSNMSTYEKLQQGFNK